jgi:2-polyprenyl-6-methoxyphenol hydroxylase-like FAD-dependent oxidoreductase
MAESAKDRPQVLIVGAGPTGLAAAIELGMRGIRARVIDRNSRGGTAPRAKTTNVRTRTHLRRWGIAGKLAAEAPFGVDYPNDMIFVTRLAGHKLAHFHDAFNAAPARSDLYPEHAQWVPQYKLEKVMLEHAHSLPAVDVTFDTTFVSARQDRDGVVATLKDGSAKSLEVCADYLIGADGARSVVRELLGLRLDGARKLSHSYNIIFRAPGLAQAHAHGRGVMYVQVSKDGASAIGPMDSGDKWYFMPLNMPEGKTLSEAEALALIRQRTGIDLPYEILSADSWVASAWLADRYRDGRILLAGDACHLHPPTGGYGMNMGVGDGVDLGWKLAAVLQGWAKDRLLDSYQVERRPIHKAVIEESVANLAAVANAPPAAIEDDSDEGSKLRAMVGASVQESKTRECHTLGTVLGLGYEGSPWVAGENSPAPRHVTEHYTPTARPGYLAPHAWLADGRSLYDAFGPGFTLLVAPEADEADIRAAQAQAAARRLPLQVLRPEGVDVRQLYQARLALIRPDQHVAWRGECWLPKVLDIVTGGSMKTETSRRSGVIAVHSVHRFVYTVPDLKVARQFYEAFGLDVREIASRLDLYTFGNTHCWASLFQAPGPKKLQYIAYGIFAEDEPTFRERITRSGQGIAPHALAVHTGGLWLRDPDGIATQLVVADKCSPSKAFTPAVEAPRVPGKGVVAGRSKVKQVRPTHLSHVLRYSPDVLAMIQFNTEQLGLRLSDKSMDIVAFMHTPHGSDHHLVAYAKSHAPGLHHSSWDVSSIDDIGNGAEQMRVAGYTKHWGLGRHVLGSNYFNYVADPWGSWCEYSYGIDFVPPTHDWIAGDHHPEDSMYQWGPAFMPEFIDNLEVPMPEAPGKTA